MLSSVNLPGGVQVSSSLRLALMALVRADSSVFTGSYHGCVEEEARVGRVADEALLRGGRRESALGCFPSCGVQSAYNPGGIVCTFLSC
jgi:hypothetical protein